MVTLIVIGISIHSRTQTPLILLYPLGSQKLLCLPIDPMEAFTVSKALHSFSEKGEHATSIFPTSPKEESQEKIFNREEEVLKRLLVHDVTLNALANLDGKLQTVSLVAEEEGFYSARVVIEGPKGVFSLNCCPADAIALALRGKTPILIAESLLAYAEELSDVMDSLPEHVQKTINATLIAESPLLLALKEEHEKNSENLLDHPSLANIRKLAIQLEKNKIAIEQNSLFLGGSEVKKININDILEKTVLGELSDAEQWTDLLSSLTPETKNPM